MPLTPSQRIHAIKGIAERLREEDWPLVDLTLQQFGLPRTDSWQGSKQSYIVSMISEASDDALNALGVHVGLHPEQGPPRVDPPFWLAGMLRVFLSHLSAHRRFAAD